MDVYKKGIQLGLILGLICMFPRKVSNWIPLPLVGIRKVSNWIPFPLEAIPISSQWGGVQQVLVRRLFAIIVKERFGVIKKLYD